MPFRIAYIFDIDGTIADCTHRLHYIEGEKKNWQAFYDACKDDEPIKQTIRLLWRLHESGAQIIFITGRPEKTRKATALWLKKHVFGLYTVKPEIRLYMRSDGDYRQDKDVKEEIYKNTDWGMFRIEAVFEDRKQCVDMWRRLGLTCYQVADGDY